MEALHGVDVSWLHRPTEGQGPTATAPPQKPPPSLVSAPAPASSAKTPAEAKVEIIQPPPQQRQPAERKPALQQTPSKGRRPGVVSRGSSEKVSTKSSWMSSISSKFSSSDKSAPSAQTAQAKSSAAPPSKIANAGHLPETVTEAVEEDLGPTVDQKSKSGFFSSALRRLSSNQPQRGVSVSSIASIPSPRQTLNIDRGRERCTIEELNLSKLRRVAFRVDVELMGGSKFAAELNPDQKETPKMKYKEKGEGEALKHTDELNKEIAAAENEEAAALRHVQFETDKPALKQKERGEGETFKHPQLAKEEKIKHGRDALGNERLARSPPPPAQRRNQDDWDDLDPYGSVKRKISPQNMKKEEQVKKPNELRPGQMSRIESFDALDPFGGGLARPQKKPDQSKLRQHTTPQASQHHIDDWDDIDPYGGGRRPSKEKEKPVLRRPLESDDEDALHFFYSSGSGPQRGRTGPGSTLPAQNGAPTTRANDSSEEDTNFLERNTSNTPAMQAPTAIATQDFQAPTSEQIPMTAAGAEPKIPSTSSPVPDPAQTGVVPNAPEAAPKDRPTTDPLRVYRRCCQLREAPVLKRISEQLSNLQASGLEMPGTVSALNLNKSRMQLQDIVCLADWLAIVPVKKLTVEDANLTDDGLRLILSSLLAAKVPDNKRKHGKSSPNRVRDHTERTVPGMIERLSFKNNRKITAEGWMHLCLFLNMSKTIQAIDVSMIPFPPNPQLVAGKRRDSNDPASMDIAEVLRKCLVGRAANKTLKELLIAECALAPYQVGKICQAAGAAGLERLGLASNHLDPEGLQHLGRYLSRGVATGIDIGGNDLHGQLPILAKALTKEPNNPLWAISLANCNLDVEDLEPVLKAFTTLPDVRLLDLSHQNLFKRSDTLQVLRKYLPKMPMLKRIQLNDTSMTPAQAIGIAEILPECRNLAHLNLLDNSQIRAVLVEPVDTTAQEEAAAVYACMMTAVRLSKTLVCIDIDVPGPKSSEIVKALARQVVAYCLRNIERFTEYDAIKVADAAAALPDIESDEGGKPHAMKHFLEDHEHDMHDDAHGAHEDYLVSGTGIVKALSYCLNASQLRRMSVQTGTPREMLESDVGKATAKEMSKELLESAAKFRDTLQPLMSSEMGSANPDSGTIRRLKFLDDTLQGIIERFEREYPDARQRPVRRTSTSSVTGDVEAVEPTFETRSRSSSVTSARSAFSPDIPGVPSYERSFEEPASPPFTLPFSWQPGTIHPGSRRGSHTDFVARAQVSEEAAMLRLGQQVRRQLLPPTGTSDYLHGTSVTDSPEPAHIAALRERVEAIGGAELREQILKKGLERTVKDFVEDAERLRILELEEPAKFHALREAQASLGL